MPTLCIPVLKEAFLITTIVFLIFIFIYVYTYMCECLCVSMTVCENLQRPEEGITSPLLELQTVGRHSLEEQQMLFNP